MNTDIMANISKNVFSHSAASGQSALGSVIHYLRYSPVGYPFWQYWIDAQDPRTADYFLVGCSPYPVVAIMIFYLYFVLKLGPAIMKDRKPFNLKYLMLTYNITLAFINAYFVTLVVYHCDYGRRFIDFKYPDRSNRSPQAMYELSLGWWYWMSKFVDLFDTVFFVLRKKDKTHATFLHLYHHTVVPIFGYLCLKHNAIMPATAMFCLINGSIHVIMYSYYALAALGPHVQKYLWWKKYITQMQLGQFLIGILYGIFMIFKQEGYPQFWFWFGMTQPPIFYKMFHNFYKQSYEVKQKKMAEANGKQD